jgi:hypothetical protein
MNTHLRHQPEPAERAELLRLLPAPAAPDLSRDRHRLLKEHLMNEITQVAERPSPATTVRVAPRRRARLRLALVAAPLALAGIVAGAVAISGQRQSTPATGEGWTAAPVVAVVPGDPGGAAPMLQKLALVAAAAPAQPAHAGQFVYVESTVASTRTYTNVDTKTTIVQMQSQHRRQVWQSLDGKKGWLIEAGTTPAAGMTLDTDLAPRIGTPSYDYLATLATDPDTLLAKIYAETRGKGTSPDQQAFSTIGDLLFEQIAPPALNAALYRTAAKIPGVERVDDAVDATGRHGVAVARVDQASGQRTEWIFDRDTSELLGERTVQLRESEDGIKPGTVTLFTSVTKRAIVDKMKQLPGTN